MTSKQTYVDAYTIAGSRVDIDLPNRTNEIRAALPGRRRRSETIYKAGGLTLVLITMEAGDTIPAHSASGPSTIHVLEGRVEVTSGGPATPTSPGQLIAFAPNVAHDIRAVDSCVVLLTVAAIDEDPRNEDVAPPRGPLP
ncbi:MAG TPA: cupin domain-containing protein [Tepidiformaceae bacterium]|nr:cupin domain-containing protein [Tepidiformaceae bacterium]